MLASRRGKAASICLGALVLLAPAGARAGLADQVGATFALLSSAFAGAFPPVEGMVVGVEGETLYMDLAEKNGVSPGQEFTIFRKGEVFRHPLTNQPLGRFEERLGYAQVVRIFPQYAAARYIPMDGKPRPRPEDGVRITRARIKTAVAPLLDLTQSGADFRRVPYLVALSLERTKRFEVKDPQAVATLFAAERVRVEAILNDPGLAARLGRSLEVVGWVVPVLLERRGVTYLDATWLSAVTGTALFSKREVLTRPEPAEEQRFPWEPLAE
jgi:hypothetical protein